MPAPTAPESSADQLFAALTQARGRILLTGPVAPDGDSLGACLALQRLLASRGVAATVAGHVSYRYTWMPGAADILPDDAVRPEYDVVVVLDGDRFRLTGPVAAAFERASVRGIVDHHASTRPDGYTHCWLEPEATSTCTMLQRAAERWGFPLDPDLATCLYTGLVFDTGGFRYSNTGPATHQMAARLLEAGVDHVAVDARVLAERRISGLRVAGLVYREATFDLGGRLAIGEVGLDLARACGVVEGDLEGLVESLLHVVGVEVSVLLIEREDGSVKHSLRSRGLVDVAAVAATLSPSGGGHARAAGASSWDGLDAARARVREVVGAALDRA